MIYAINMQGFFSKDTNNDSTVTYLGVKLWMGYGLDIRFIDITRSYT
jgi:hypothetical protein